MKAGIVVGGANNQLKDDRVGDLLLKSNIIYAPDYVANAGGLISVYDEHEFKKADKNRIIKKVGEVKKRIEKILEQSEKQSRPTNEIANEMAEKIFNDKNLT
jgi:leucine dehydrogenase